MRNKQIKKGTRMPEKDRNRTQIEMQIKCLNHKAVPSFHAEDFNNLNVFLEKNKLNVEEKVQKVM